MIPDSHKIPVREVREIDEIFIMGILRNSTQIRRKTAKHLWKKCENLENLRKYLKLVITRKNLDSPDLPDKF